LEMTESATSEKLGESWSEVAAGGETWSEVSAGAETWTPVAADGETWRLAA